MATDLGTELPQRTALAWAMVVGAAVLAFPTYRVLRSAAGDSGTAGTWILGVGMALLLVGGPLFLAWGLTRVHVHVSESTLTRTYGDRPVHRLELAQVERIQVGLDAGFRAITVWGDDPDGRPLEFPVSTAYVADLEPLARRLDAIVAERDDVFLDDFDRTRWEDFRRSGS